MKKLISYLLATMQRCLFLLLFFCYCSNYGAFAQTNGNFAAEKLTALIGKKTTSSEVQALFAYCGNNLQTQTTNQYIYPLRGILVELNGEQIDRITIFNQDIVWNEIKFSRFAEKLFKDISFDDSRVLVVHKIGRATQLYEDAMVYQIGETEVSFHFNKQIQKIVITSKRCIVGNCKEGYGVFLSRVGDRYEGIWKNKIRNGKGTCYYANGDKYEGNWLQDKPDGQGKMTYKGGTVKQGIWEQGNFKGELNLRNNMLADLLGKHKTDNKVTSLLAYYEKEYDILPQNLDYQRYKLHNHKLVLHFDEYGFVQRVEVNRSGVQTYFSNLYGFLHHHSDEKHIFHLFGEPDKKLEIADTAHKRAVWFYKDSAMVQEFYFTPKKHFHSLQLALAEKNAVLKNKPIGECIKGNCKNGYGEMKTQFGIYKGAFKQEFFSGKGRLNYTNGGYYRGWFKNNVQQGYGYRRWTDKSSYIGNWKSNLFHGRGTFNDANKNRYEGDWKNGLRNGYGKMRYADGSLYLGYWKEDKRNGKGILKLKNGKRKAGIWVADVMQ